MHLHMQVKDIYLYIYKLVRSLSFQGDATLILIGSRTFIIQRLWNTLQVLKYNLTEPIPNRNLHRDITCIKTPEGQCPVEPGIDLAETCQDSFPSITGPDP